jgi:SdpC family antimicrobial peptide
MALLGLPQRAFAQSVNGQRDFTGEEIFRGLFFGEAPASQLFPEIWDSKMVAQTFDTKDKVIAWADLKERVVAEMILNDATFMDRFAVEMQSGDQLRVQAVLGESSQKMSVAMQSLGYLDSDGNPVPDLSIFIFGAVALVLAVGLAGIGFSLVYYYYYHAVTVFRYYQPRPGEIVTEEEARLYQEMLVSSITEKLATAQ